MLKKVMLMTVFSVFMFPLFWGCSSSETNDIEKNDTEALKEELKKKIEELEIEADAEQATKSDLIDMLKHDSGMLNAPNVFEDSGSLEPAPEEDKSKAVSNEEHELLKEEEEKNLIEQEAKLTLSNKYYETALRYYRNNNLLQAREQLLRAIKVDNENKKAETLLSTINKALGYEKGNVDEILEAKAEKYKIKIQKAQAEIDSLFKQGMQAMNEEEYDEAIKLFEKVEEKFSYLTYDIGMNDIRERSKVEKINAENLRKKNLAEKEGKLREGSIEAAKMQEEQAERLKNEILVALTKKCLDYFDNENYEKAYETAGRILELHPDKELTTLISNIKVDSLRAQQKGYYSKFLKQKRESWDNMFNKLKEKMLPNTDDVMIEYPDKDYWYNIVLQRAKKSLLAEQIEESPLNQEVRNKLNILTIPALKYKQANIQEIIDYIQSYFTDSEGKREISIIVVASEVGDQTIDLNIKRPITLKQLLDTLMDLFGLSYIIRDGNVIITSKEKSYGKPIPNIFNVKDIIMKIQNFPGRKYDFVTPEGGEDEPFAATEPQSIPVEDLTDLIKNNVAPETWDNIDGVVIEQLESVGILYIKQIPSVQKQISDFLSKLRLYTGTMVSIEARFINAYDDFLQDIGVDTRGLPTYDYGTQTGTIPEWGVSPSPPGTTPTDDNTLLTGEVIPSAGIGTREGFGATDFYDLRFRQTNVFSPAAGSTQLYPIGSRLNSRGGVGLTYTFLNENDTLLTQVMRMVEKDQKAYSMAAPRITCFNTQRANISIIEQRAYIKDYNIELASDIRAYDPVVGILEEGIILDVKPIVSYDRKYVTMEVRVNWMDLQSMYAFSIIGPPQSIDTATIPTGSALTTLTWIELPWVRNYRTMSTVKVPDRGTLILSGMQNGTDVFLNSETPILGKIPILGFFFRRKAKSTELRNVILLMKPTIIDIQEEENLFMK